MPRHILLGSSGSLFKDQEAVDIYLQQTDLGARPEPNTPQRWRIAMICVGWGMSIAAEQSSNHQGPWRYVPIMFAQRKLQVVSLGLRPVLANAPPPQAVIQALTHGNLPPIGVYLFNGNHVHGWHCPWHHRLHITNVGHDTNQLHYYKHKRRRGHGPPPPPRVPPKHFALTSLGLGTQVQNYRDGYLA